MKGFLKKTTAAVGALAITASSVPFAVYSDVHAADDALMTRDIWFADADVNRWESEHFQFIWGKNGADSAKITTAFLEENAKNLEACWDIYMNDLSMEPPTQSVNMALRDGNKYKVNFYISGTGLQRFADDWAYMGYDDQGYAFMFCCVGAMQNSPNPSWVLPHEFGHVVTAHQLGWNDNKYVSSWWEAIANWYREQFLYSDYYQQWVTDPASGTDYFETYMKNHNVDPINPGKDIKVKDLNLDSGSYIVFCWNKDNFYHMLPIIDNVVYDKDDRSMELYTISLYKQIQLIKK